MDYVDVGNTKLSATDYEIFRDERQRKKDQKIKTDDQAY
jgi:hypothetical protein